MKKWPEFEKSGRNLEKWLDFEWTSVRVGFTGFKIKNQKLTCWGQVSEVRTRVRLPESSDRVVVGRMGWAGCRLPWTPLTLLNFFIGYEF